MNVRAVQLIVCGEEILITADEDDYILPDDKRPSDKEEENFTEGGLYG